ncbi:hypothetical protein BKA62DRAFT_767508 [Auriculariales sp. MPI-PUGE-AT-0066]|nr:hypothetical protein BKA62DRAFT_767508 [Auriculariales sp. MPI-PUGE-AT-0066]
MSASAASFSPFARSFASLGSQLARSNVGGSSMSPSLLSPPAPTTNLTASSAHSPHRTPSPRALGTTSVRSLVAAWTAATVSGSSSDDFFSVRRAAKRRARHAADGESGSSTGSRESGPAGIFFPTLMYLEPELGQIRVTRMEAQPARSQIVTAHLTGSSAMQRTPSIRAPSLHSHTTSDDLEISSRRLFSFGLSLSRIAPYASVAPSLETVGLTISRNRSSISSRESSISGRPGRLGSSRKGNGSLLSIPDQGSTRANGRLPEDQFYTANPARGSAFDPGSLSTPDSRVRSFYTPTESSRRTTTATVTSPSLGGLDALRDLPASSGTHIGSGTLSYLVLGDRHEGSEYSELPSTQSSETDKLSRSPGMRREAPRGARTLPSTIGDTITQGNTDSEKENDDSINTTGVGVVVEILCL